MDPNCPWNVAPTLPKGDDDAGTIYASVGYAISQWEILEGALGHLFGALVGASDSAGAERAYGMLQSFGGRHDMLMAAADAFIYSRNDPSLQGISDYLGRVRSFAARRNEIAHGHAISFTHNNVSRGIYWCPPSYNSRKLNPPEKMDFANGSVGLGKYAYTSAQIAAYGNAFHALRDPAFDFYAAAFALWKKVRESGSRPEHISGGTD